MNQTGRSILPRQHNLKLQVSQLTTHPYVSVKNSVNQLMQEQVLAVCRSRNSEYSCRCAPAKDRQAGRWNNPLVLKPSHHPPKIDPQWDSSQNTNKTLTTRSRSASSVGRLGQSWEMKQYPGLADMPMENAMLATAEGKQTFKMYLEQAVRTWHFFLNLDLIIYWIPHIIQVLNLSIVKIES